MPLAPRICVVLSGRAFDRELGSPSSIRQASLAALATTWHQSRQGEDTLGTFGFSREVNASFRTRPTNVSPLSY